jgi:endoglucanase
MSQNLDKTSTAELPPDWIAINSTTGAIIPVPNNAVLTTNYSYDAMRVPFRMAVEYQWFGDDRAKVVLQKMSFLQTAWNENGLLDVTYAHDGTVVTSQEAPAIYGGDLGYFEIIDPTTATKIYNNKLKVLYDPDTNSWKGDVGYYDDNWAWFGMALHDGAYDNLDAQP